MESVEIKDYSAIVSGLITALSTLCAVLLTNYYHYKTTQQNIEATNKHRLAEVRLNKLEEFYLLFEKWETNFSNIYLHHMRAYTGLLSYGEVLELTTKQDLVVPGEAQKILMLLNIHFPLLLEEYQHVNTARANLVPYIMDDPKDNDLNAKEFRILQEEFEAVCKIFKNKVGLYASNL